MAAGMAGRQARAQLTVPDGTETAAPNPLTDPTAKPGKVLLFELEARFARDVRERGGAGFASWFAEDGVTLGNGAAPVVGRVAIAKSANWKPEDSPTSSCSIAIRSRISPSCKAASTSPT